MIAAGPAALDLRPRSRLPEPGRFWIRHVPRTWPAPEARWVDLANARLGRPGAAAERLPAIEAWDLDDVVYLPPVPERLAGARDTLARSLLAAGTPVLVQRIPGQPVSPGSSAPPGSTAIYDLTEALLSGELSPLEALPAASNVVWPLIGGVTDDPDLWDRAAPVLAGAGVAVVQPLGLELDPSERRWLAGLRPEASYERIFHGAVPPEREFSARAVRRGFQPFLERPLPPAIPNGPRGRIVNRRAAGALALAGEMWLRLGREEGAGQALLAAARHLDRLPHPIEDLARDGNLALLDWLGERGRRMVEEVCATRPPALVTALLAEYLEAAPKATT